MCMVRRNPFHPGKQPNMKRALLSAPAALSIACPTGASIAYARADSPAVSAADVTKAPRMGPWGFDLAGMDRSVKPGDDFGKFASGTYLANLQIPADRTSWGSFNALRELSDARIKAVIDRSAATPNAQGEAQQIGGLYNSFMDEATVEALDARPLAADLAAIRAASTRDALAGLMGQSNGGFGGTFFPAHRHPDAPAPHPHL